MRSCREKSKLASKQTVSLYLHLPCQRLLNKLIAPISLFRLCILVFFINLSVISSYAMLNRMKMKYQMRDDFEFFRRSSSSLTYVSYFFFPLLSCYTYFVCYAHIFIDTERPSQAHTLFIFSSLLSSHQPIHNLFFSFLFCFELRMIEFYLYIVYTEISYYYYCCIFSFCLFRLISYLRHFALFHSIDSMMWLWVSVG